MTSYMTDLTTPHAPDCDALKPFVNDIVCSCQPRLKEIMERLAFAWGIPASAMHFNGNGQIRFLQDGELALDLENGVFRCCGVELTEDEASYWLRQGYKYKRWYRAYWPGEDARGIIGLVLGCLLAAIAWHFGILDGFWNTWVGILHGSALWQPTMFNIVLAGCVIGSVIAICSDMGIDSRDIVGYVLFIRHIGVVISQWKSSPYLYKWRRA